MSGGAMAEVDFNERLVPGQAILPVPESGDDFETISRKMKALAQVAESGKSLAIHTGFKRAVHQERDPEKLARDAMTPAEAMQFDAWKNGARLPTFEGAQQRKPWVGSSAARKRMQRRADAMNTAWGTDGLDVDNANYLTSNISYAIPLMSAISRVRGMTRDLHGGQAGLDDMQLAEIQTIHKVNSVAISKINKISELLKTLSDHINKLEEKSQALQAREHALKLRITDYKPKKDPINAARASIARPQMSANFDYRAAISGSGAVRASSLLTGTGLETGRQGREKRRRVEKDEEEGDGGAPIV